MKTIKRYFTFLFTAILFCNAASAQQPGVDSTGLPGDDFSLQGALQLFKDATSLEDFEKAINSEGNYVNNLDLDGDGNIDYVKVNGKKDGDAHIFILQVDIDEKETQDIAVIELEKTGNETAVIQIIGDEDIYGEQVIIEPDSENGTSDINFINNSNLSGPNVSLDAEAAGIVNVWFWPSVRFVFAPSYRIWVSPWRWRYYPNWWKPWRPLGWAVWHPFRVRHHRSFIVTHTHRVVTAHRVYTPFRSSSRIVSTRHSARVNNFRVTRTRTTVTGPRGNTTTVKKTTVTGPRGNKATKVKVKRR